MAQLTLELLAKSDARSTNAIIDAFAADSLFASFAAKETSQILERDSEDAEKLAAGIRQAVARGVLPANPPVEPLTSIDVLGKDVDTVCSVMISKLGDAPSDGCVMVLSGLSGTGKGTTVAALQAALPRAVTWSNGNVFRALTFLALEHCEASGTTLSERVLTPELLAALLRRLEFGKAAAAAGGGAAPSSTAGAYDTIIHSSSRGDLRVSQVHRTYAPLTSLPASLSLFLSPPRLPLTFPLTSSPPLTSRLTSPQGPNITALLERGFFKGGQRNHGSSALPLLSSRSNSHPHYLFSHSHL